MNCNFVAPLYKYLEYARFGRVLDRCRDAQLARLGRCSRVLVLGEGDGRFLTRYLAAYPTVTGDAFDASKEMVRLARGRLERLPHDLSPMIKLHVADVRLTQFEQAPYDLVVTHFFFDVFRDDELRLLIERVSEVLSPDALWLISDFDLPKGTTRRAIAHFWIQLMYLFFRWTTGLKTQRLPEWRHLMRDAGFILKSKASFQNGFVVSELWQRDGCT